MASFTLLPGKRVNEKIISFWFEFLLGFLLGLPGESYAPSVRLSEKKKNLLYISLLSVKV